MSKNRIIPVLGLAALIPMVAWAQSPGQTPAQAPPAATTPSKAPVAAPVGAPPGQSLSPTPPGFGATQPGAATSGPAAPSEPPTEAETTLDDAIKKVQGLKSVSADVTQKVEMLGQRFELKGQYLKASDYRIYLKLALSGLGDASGTMLQVCDGATLWDYHQLLTDRYYQRIEIGKILKKLEGPEFDAEIRKQVLDRFGFAGPDSLLVGLRATIKFDRKDSETLDGRPVWVLRGKWKDIARVNGPNQQPMPAAAPMPAYIPSVATVLIGQEDGWPYKVLLEGRIPSILEDTRQYGQDGRPIGAKGSGAKQEPSRILLIYENVQINPELEPKKFAFEAPPEAPVTDLTEQYLIFLEQTAAMQAERKKAEAAREGADIAPPFLLPKPPAEGPPPIEKAKAAPK